MNNQKTLHILLSGGGTGGHIFPAVAIADAIKALRPDTKFLFVGASGRMEMEKVPQAGYPIEGLWISGLKREISATNLLFPLKVMASMWKALRIVRRFKPDVVVGTGGFASGPTLRVAGTLGYTTVVQEQNSFPGITNKILAAKASRIYVAYDGLEKYFPARKIVVTGNPIRQEAVAIMGKRGEGARFFGLDPQRTTVLVVGGSQGARSINQAVKTILNQMVQAGLQLIWQTGVAFEKEAQDAIASIQGQGLVATAFISRMDYAYAAADMIISRAGAIAIAELSVVGKPVILIPLPTAAEDHQRHNAEALVKKGAAILVADNRLKEDLAVELMALAQDKNRASSLGNAISTLGHAHADMAIAEDIIHLIEAKQ